MIALVDDEDIQEVTLERLDAIRRDFALSPAQLIVYDMARESVARYIQVRDRINAEGLMLPGRYTRADGTTLERLNPLCGLESQARAAAIRAVRALSAETLYKRDPERNESDGID
jgi:hypothetical protein